MSKASKLTELRATQTLLQRAHDYIEANGFNISLYATGSTSGPCCYIGTLRRVAGLKPEPQFAGWHETESRADYGDGPELTRAFKVLDAIAKRKLPKDSEWHAQVQEREYQIGRWVEAFGFHRADELGGDLESQAADALRIFRKALTKVYKQIEALEAKIEAS